jgi:uncharacterized protein
MPQRRAPDLHPRQASFVTEVPRVWRGVLAAFAFVALAAASAQETPRDGLQPVPPLTARVTDLTGTLSAPERQALEAKLTAWESQTTNQLAVLIVPTTQPETVEQYGIRVAEAWKLGQKGRDNGVLFLVAKNDKRMRIEVGYGLEGNLPDVAARRIIGDTVAPLFSKGQFAAGIDAGVERIMRVASGDEPPPKEPRRRVPSHGLDFGTIALIFLVAVPVVGAMLRSILGNVGGGLAGAGVAGGAIWLFAGSLVFAAIAGIIAFVLIAFTGFGGRGGPGMWIPGGGGGWSGGGGGFSGGGGGFGGGGASGGWD